MKNRFSRIAIVTGASAGIGHAVAKRFASEGYGVVINARRKERLQSLQKEIGEACCYVEGDASDPVVIERLFATAKENFDRAPDIVVVNAGRGLGGSVSTADLAQFEEVIRVNLVGAAKLLQTASRELQVDLESRPYPCFARDIIVLGSTVGRNISPFSVVYGSTKFAVHSLTEGLRRELAPKGIRVSLIEPGIVLSEFQKGAGYSDDLVKGFDEKFGPLLIGEDIATVVQCIVSQPAHIHLNEIMVRPTRQDYP